MHRIFRIVWDDANEFYGTFPYEFATREDAQKACDWIEAAALSDGLWGYDGYCRVVESLSPTPADGTKTDVSQFDRYLP